MTYQEMTDNLVNPAFRGRAEMCIREQGAIYANDGRPDIAALGKGVVGNSWMDIEALMASVAAGPNSTPAVTDDGALLSAVQAAWPSVAAARYPGAVAMAAGLSGSPAGSYGYGSSVTQGTVTFGPTGTPTATTGSTPSPEADAVGPTGPAAEPKGTSKRKG